MKTRTIFPGLNLKVLTLMLTGFLTVQFLAGQSWSNRAPITIANSLSEALTNYQVKVALGSEGPWSTAYTDGSDLRFTASDGITEIPYWIEGWAHNASATIWVKVPSIAASDGDPETPEATIYMYYGASSLPSLESFATPPAGTFEKDARNPGVIRGTGAPAVGTAILPENIVYDDETGHYWMVLTIGTNVGLIWSDDPTNPDAWNWSGNKITNGVAPHLMKHDGTWYIFYSNRAIHSSTNPNGWPISVASSSTVSGTYIYGGEILATGPSGSWESWRVDEPYVFQRNDGKWVLMYMAETGLTDEQVGYATADNLLGPYTKYTSNPCIPFGPVGSIDHGTVADPWVYEFKGVYYIGYTVSTTSSSPWQTALATTTDWETFTRHGVILPTGSEFNSFRGAVTRIGDQYVFPYTGGPSSGNYRLCIATQPVYQNQGGSNGQETFDFFDGFDGTSLYETKWGIAYSASTTEGIITVADSAIVIPNVLSSAWTKLYGKKPFGTGFLMETMTKHDNPGSGHSHSQGFNIAGTFNTATILRLFSDPVPGTYPNWRYQAASSGYTWNNMDLPVDDEFHLFGIYRYPSGTNTARFSLDGGNYESVISSSFVPTGDLFPFFVSYGANNSVTSKWIRVRQWKGAEMVTEVGAGESISTHEWTGSESTEWNTAGNWTGGVPGSWSIITIPSTVRPAVLAGDLTLGSTSSLTIGAGGSLTIDGDLNYSGTTVINSSMSPSQSGSLIVTGTSTGNIIYNRFLRLGNDSGDKHLFSSPVEGQSIFDFISRYDTKIDAIRTWDEENGVWSEVNTGNFVKGKGYNVYQTDQSDGDFSFAGSLVNSASITATSPYALPFDDRSETDPYGNDDPTTIEWTAGREYIEETETWTNWGGGGWNLLGNPFTSALKITDTDDDLTNDFLNANEASFDPSYVAVYIYNGPGSQYLYKAKSDGFVDPTEDESPANALFNYNDIQAGQGFMVMANNDQAQFLFQPEMQVHSVSVPMMKSAKTENSWPGLQLKAKAGTSESLITVFYHETMTAGLDPGYDVGKFGSGNEVELYTTLVENDNGVNFARQALPIEGADKAYIPVGVDSEKGGEVIFSAYSVQIGINKFWLEDRTTGIFTDLTTKSYTVTLPAKTYGTGRFFIIASTNTPTGIKPPETEDTGVRIWTANQKVIIKGSVGDQAKCEVYDLNGKLVIKRLLTDGEVNIVDLPADTHGVYFVRVTEGVKVTTRKVAIL